MTRSSTATVQTPGAAAALRHLVATRAGRRALPRWRPSRGTAGPGPAGGGVRAITKRRRAPGAEPHRHADRGRGHGQDRRGRTGRAADELPVPRWLPPAAAGRSERDRLRRHRGHGSAAGAAAARGADARADRAPGARDAGHGAGKARCHRRAAHVAPLRRRPGCPHHLHQGRDPCSPVRRTWATT